jgi:hypothetical protein
MARVTGPDFIALQVRDLEASARFYEQRLAQAGTTKPAGRRGIATEPIAFAVQEPLGISEPLRSWAGASPCGSRETTRRRSTTRSRRPAYR